MEPARQIDQQVVAGHQHLDTCVVTFVHLGLVVDLLQEFLLLLLEEIIVLLARG